jgi:WD40 repeat protein/energy-coupling factor transporter ATP-binding protein EcfA2
MQELNHSSNPFPGLRPFEATETHLFFGRDGQSEELLRRLRRTRFLAVVGTSGSGKSSLVRAGLLPALKGGLMASAGSDWRIAILRPGNDPIGNLARALASPLVLGSRDEKNVGMQEILAETTLRRSSLGLAELVARTRTKLDAGGQPLFHDYENLLIVVDQFEEIFRFKQLIEEEKSNEDAAAFVKLLLEAVRQPEGKVYVVLTMRSDFLGDCAQFQELPEAINDGQYLIPRMTRDERRSAIAGPVAVGEGSISEPLVNQLLNDVGDNPDQLPIMQHALMRTWEYWLGHRSDGEPIDIPDYNAIGGMAEALSRHADEAYEELSKAQEVIAEKLFKGLTERGADNREVRRPMEVREVCELTGADEAVVVAVVEVFRRKGRSFLMPPPTDALTGAPIPLTRDSLIDISHESLIRNWRRLKDWAVEEVQSARIYRRLAEAAVLHREGEEGLLQDPGLQIGLDWREKNNPNHVWARRYHPEFALAMNLLDKSQAARDAQIADARARHTREIKRTRITALILGLAFLLSLGMGALVYRAKREAEDEKKHAQELAQESKEQFYIADTNQAGRAFEDNNFPRGVELLEDHMPYADEGVAPAYAWYCLWHLYHKERATFSVPMVGAAAVGVNSVAFSPDGKTLATGCRDGAVKLWDAASRQELATLIGHSASVHAVAFSPDGKTLATACEDKTVRLWDVASHQELVALTGHTDGIYTVAFSPDGKTLATGSTDLTVKLWDAASHRELATLKGHIDGVFAVAFSPDGRTLATGSEDYTVKLWDVASHRELATLKGHEGTIYGVAFSPDGRTLATGSEDYTIKLWDVASRRELDTLKGHTDDVDSVAFSPDGRTLASSSDDGTVKLWDVTSHQEPATLTGHTDSVFTVVFSPDGRTLATSSDDGTAKLWDVLHQESDTLKGYAVGVNSVAFSPDGKTLATGGEDHTVRLWDAASHQELVALTGHTDKVSSVAFSPDGKTLATGSTDHTVRLWDAALHQELVTLKGHTDNILTVAFSPDGKTLASGGEDTTVKLWDVVSHQELATLKGYTDSVRALAFSPDGRTLASGGDDGIVKLWDVVSHQELATLKGHTDSVHALAFSPDGRTLATGSEDKTAKLWDVISRQEPTTLKGHAGGVNSVAFSPDGRTLATGSTDHAVKLWDAALHRELATLKGHKGIVHAVAFSPDGRTLATGSADSTVRLWRGATDEEVAAQRGGHVAASIATAPQVHPNLTLLYLALAVVLVLCVYGLYRRVFRGKRGFLFVHL